MRGPAGYGARNFSGDDQLGLRAPGSWHAQGDHTPLTTAADSLSRGLAPTGSIYVHLDWHAVHYVKVLMDEIFGYEHFRNEIVWKRRVGSSSSIHESNRFGTCTDVLLFYAASDETSLCPQYNLDVSDYQDYIAAKFTHTEADGRRYRTDNLANPAPRPNLMYEYKGYKPPRNGWAISREKMEEWDRDNRLYFPADKNARIQRKRYLDELKGMPVQNLWSDLAELNSQAIERLNYPTQKPTALLERIIEASSQPGGLVLDCFLGSGTTTEAAERLGRRWIGIDNAKYGIHLARKRLIRLHGAPRPPENPALGYEYVKCNTCKNLHRKEKSQKSPGPFQVSPFTIENMGVYQRANEWQDFQTQGSKYRDEMVKVFGGEVVNHSPLLHGRKGNAWVHVGPLDSAVSFGQVWNIARQAQGTGTKAVTILSADFDTLSGIEKDDIKEKTGVAITIRVIPASALDECRRRLDMMENSSNTIESMAVPAFYAPLSIVLAAKTSGLGAQVRLERCEVDIESFLASQRPMIKRNPEAMTTATRKKVQAELDKWDGRQKELNKWLAKATTWQKFIDYWAIDWDYGSRVAPDGKPIFETDWQSFRVRSGKAETDLTFVADFRYEQPGTYRVAARVTDVFGNDGIATINVEVR